MEITLLGQQYNVGRSPKACCCSGDGNGDEDGNGEGGREANKRKKPHKSCRRHVGKGGEKREKRKKERVGPVPANQDNLIERITRKKVPSLKNCTSKESLSPLSRLIRDFRNKYH